MSHEEKTKKKKERIKESAKLIDSLDPVMQKALYIATQIILAKEESETLSHQIA